MRRFDEILLQATEPFLRRLRRRLLVMILMAVVPILALILYQAKVTRDVQLVEAQENAWEIVEKVASRQARLIDTTRQLLALLAETGEIAGGNADACGDLVKRFVDHNNIYVDLGLADAEGRVACRAQKSGADNATIADASYFRRALREGTFAAGDYQFQNAGGRQSIAFAYPVKNQRDAVAAVLFAAVDLRWIGQLAAESKLPDGVALSIVDSRGTLLSRFPEPEKWIGQHIPDASLFEMLRLRSQSSRELKGLDGVDRLYALKQLLIGGAGQIYVMVGVPKEVAFGPVYRALARNLFWLGLVSISAVSFAWLIGSKYVVGCVKSRTEREEMRARLAAIVESSEDAIVGMRLDGIVTSWNAGAQAMYGYEEWEMIGQPLERLIPEDLRSEVADLLEIVKLGRGINRYESKRMRKNGEIFDVSASLSPIRDSNGKIIGAATIMRDVTLLRKGEERLLAYTAQLENLNSTFQDIAGTLSVAEVVERSLARIVSSGGFDHAIVRFSAPAGGRDFYGVSARPCAPQDLERLWRHLGADFEQCFWQCRNPWFVDDAAEAPELAMAWGANAIKSLAVLPLIQTEPLRATMALLSEQARAFGEEEKQFLHATARQVALAIENARLYGATLEANASLRREIEERKRAEKTLADFTAMVAHDLRSPLSNVLSITDAIRERLFGPVTEAQEKWLWKAQEICRSLIGHVSDFLDLSKIDAGKLDLVKERADLAALIRERLLEYSVEAGKRRIALKSEISEHLPPLFLDRRRINQVVDNLLSNAFKFTDAGGAVEVAVCAEGDEVVVRVKDTGIGIPADEIELIFDKYRQVISGPSSHRGGTGLGLAICKKIVEAHGGQIWAESEIGRGTTMSIRLPADIDVSRLEA
jgi:PAS domain S-box-containing protein